jgi:hypothetical protein
MDFGSLVGDVVGPIASLIGTNQTNQKNWDIAQSNNQWSAQQFAQRYQTTVKDMQAAGLNPMLAYSQGGGTPPTASQVAPMQNALGNAVESYNRGRSTTSAIDLQRQQVAQSQAQVGLTNAQSAKTAADTLVSQKQAELIDEDIQKRKQETPLVKQQTATSESQAIAYANQAIASAAQAAQSYKQVEVLTQNLDNLKAELKRIQQNNDQTAPESEIAKKYPTTYYIFHKLLPSLSGSIGKPFNYRQ